MSQIKIVQSLIHLPMSNDDVFIRKLRLKNKKSYRKNEKYSSLQSNTTRSLTRLGLAYWSLVITGSIYIGSVGPLKGIIFRKSIIIKILTD